MRTLVQAGLSDQEQTSATRGRQAKNSNFHFTDFLLGFVSRDGKNSRVKVLRIGQYERGSENEFIEISTRGSLLFQSVICFFLPICCGEPVLLWPAGEERHSRVCRGWMLENEKCTRGDSGANLKGL
jgi:hypothetical protein